VNARRLALPAAIAFTWLMVLAWWWAREHGRSDLGWWLRLAASAGFVLTGLAAGGLRSGYGRAILIGLFFGWWGDFFLIRGGTARFVAGLVAFLIGHLAYCSAFVMHRSRPRGAAAAFAGMMGAGVLLAWWLLPHIDKPLRAPTIAYGLVISAMVALAIGTLPRAGGWVIAAGAVTFYVSDIGVGYLVFVGSSHTVALVSTVLYILGQTLLAASIAAARRKEGERP